MPGVLRPRLRGVLVVSARRYRITWPDMNDVTAIRYDEEAS